MPRARISNLTLDGTLSPFKRARITRLSLDGTSSAGNTRRARISRLTLLGTVVPHRARISQLQLVGSGNPPLVPVLSIIGSGSTEPGDTITVTTVGTSGSSVILTWEITSGGAGVTLTGSGPYRTLAAPRDYQGRSITVQVMFTDAYGATATRSVTITVHPQQFWACRQDGTFIPVTAPFVRL